MHLHADEYSIDTGICLTLRHFLIIDYQIIRVEKHMKHEKKYTQRNAFGYNHTIFPHGLRGCTPIDIN